MARSKAALSKTGRTAYVAISAWRSKQYDSRFVLQIGTVKINLYGENPEGQREPGMSKHGADRLYTVLDGLLPRRKSPA